MPPITKDNMELLVKHQELESDIHVLNSKLSGIEQRLDTLDRELVAFEVIIENEKDMIKELQQKYRSFESDSQMNIAKMEKSREKLKTVKTNKEYQSSLKEIDDIKEITSRIEDSMLECLERIEDVEKNISLRQGEFSQLKSRIEQEKDLIRRESEDDKNRLGRLEKDLVEVAKTIDPGLMNQYNRVKNKVGRLAVVSVKDSVCRGCNVNIPPQMYNELQRCTNLFYCPHCQRIIYPNSLIAESID